MIIKSIFLKNFKKFSNSIFEFGSGLNVLIGPNEAGKSTISQAIMIAFFSDPNTRSRAFFSKIKPWENKNKKPVIELVFEKNSQTYRLIKDFENKVAKLYNFSDAIELDNLEEINEFLFFNLGIEDMEVYKSTGWIEQESISKIKPSNNMISTIQNSVLDLNNEYGGNSVKLKISEIKKEMSNLVKGTKNLAKNPGPIKQFLDQSIYLERELEEIKNTWLQIKRTIENSRKNEKQISEILDRKNILERLVINHKNYQEANKKVSLLDEQIEKLTLKIENIEKIKRQVKINKLKLEEYTKLNSGKLEEYTESLLQIEQDLRRSKNLIEETEDQKIILEKQLKPIKPIYFLYSIVVSIFSGVAVYFLGKNILTATMAFLFPLIVTVSYFLYSKYFSFTKRQIKHIEQRLENLEKLYTKDKEKMDKLIEYFGFSSKDDLLNYKNKSSEIEFEVNNLEAKLEGMLSESTVEDLRKKQTILLTEKRNIEVNDLTDEVIASCLAPKDFVSKARELEELELQYNNLKNDLIISQTRIKDSNISLEQISYKEGELEQTKNRLKYFEYKYKVLENVNIFLERALKDTSALVSNIVSEDISKYLPIITTGKYQNVKLGENLEIEVFDNKCNDWIEPKDNLSVGALDQIYFLKRLALFKLVRGNGTAPIMLDDPFTSFDQIRLENTMKVLNSESKDYQIILFTHNKQYQNFGIGNIQYINA